MTTRVSLDIDIGRCSRWLIWLSAAVLALGFLREGVMYAFGTETLLKDLRHIALDTEHCLGSYYSSALMLIAAGLMAVLGQASESARRGFQWRLLAVVFVLMSLDESVSFHEVLIEPLRPAFAFSSYLHFAWIVPGALFVLAFGLAYIPFVFSLRPRLRNRVIVSGALYVTGALGMEAVGGHFHSIGGFDHPWYIVSFLVEETLEITGLTLFATALLRELPSRFSQAPARREPDAAMLRSAGTPPVPATAAPDRS